MLIEHRGRRPNVHPSAYVAPTAVLCGDVRVGADARILFNAVVTAEDGSVELGERVVVMEHALVRGRAAHPVVIERDVLIGPHAHVNGVRIGAEAFIATGAALFPGATDRRARRGPHPRRRARELGGARRRRWCRSAGCVVGDKMLPPAYHADIWEIQRELDFPGHGVRRGARRRPDGPRDAQAVGLAGRTPRRPHRLMPLIAAAAVAAGAALQSATGFGFSVVAAPLVFAAVGPEEAVGLLIVLGTEVNLLTLATEGRRPRPASRECVVVLAFALPGAFAGVAALRALDPVALQIAVSIGVIATLAARHLAAGPPHARLGGADRRLRRRRR